MSWNASDNCDDWEVSQEKAIEEFDIANECPNRIN